MKKSVKNKKKKSLNNKKKERKVGKWLYWSPRVLTILFILFISLFSLDVFDPANNYTLMQMLLAFLMHNIPTFIMIIFLVFAWKYEIVGSIGFVLFGLMYIGFVLMNMFRYGFEWYYLAWTFQIALPAFIIAYLWYLNWKRKR